MNDNILKMNFVPRGNFDINTYTNYEYIDNNNDNKKTGKLKDYNEVMDNKDIKISSQGEFMGNYTMRPNSVLYSRQIYRSEFFAPPSNSINFNKDGIYEIIKNTNINPNSRLEKNN